MYWLQDVLATKHIGIKQMATKHIGYKIYWLQKEPADRTNIFT
jgi:hypothetical protein